MIETNLLSVKILIFLVVKNNLLMAFAIKQKTAIV